jgi:Tol biopolymer transport system component/predicted Ser/Thr protein kinase
MRPSAPDAPDRWPEVARILDVALDLTPEERPAFLDQACAGDDRLRAEVEAVLAGAEVDAFLKSPAAVLAAPMLDLETPVDGIAAFPGALIGPYRLVRELGHGGMGVVYLAERADGHFEQRVALKLIKRGMDSEAILRRFRAERQVLARLNHPHIARLMDGGVTAEGQPWFAMEYVDGAPFVRCCDERALEIEERLRCFGEVCEAVQYAHQNRVVHRDLKPSNILVTPAGEIKLVDFGIAKVLFQESADEAVTQTEDRLMTPEYAAPEQVRGEPVTTATDVYALGAILYQLLTGRPPHKFEHRTPAETEHVICEVEPQPPSAVVRGTPKERRLKGDLDLIVLKALRKDPAQRYLSVEALFEDLERHRTGLPVRARPQSVAYRARKFLGRHRLELRVAAIAAVLAMLGGLAALLTTRGGSREALVAGAARRVAFDAALEVDPAPSPDGRAIAFAADYGGPMRLYVTQPGGGRHAITDRLPGYHRTPRWSPDGRRIAFQSEGAIYLVPARGGTPRLLVAPTRNRWAAFPAWSPDGREIAYVENEAIYARPVAGGESRRLVPANRGPHSLAWSPDGRWIAFVAGNGAFIYGARPWGSPINLGNVSPSSIWLVPATGGDPIRVTDDRSLNMSPAWLRGSNALLFISNRQGERDVYRVDLDQEGRPRGDSRRLTTGLAAHTVALSADGERLVYAVFRQRANIWSAPLPERGPASLAEARALTTGNQAIERLAVSPDGRRLAFDSDRSGNQDVYVIPATGGDPVQVTTDLSDDFMSSWSPSGQELAIYSNREGSRQLYVMPADGGTPTAVVPLPRDQRYPSWSPDGTKLVFSSNETGAQELYVVSRSSDSSWRAARRVTYGGGDFGRWSPDGRKIVYSRRDGLWAVTPGGVPRQVLRFEDSAAVPLPPVVLWAPDGRTLYYKAFDADGQSGIWSVPIRGGARPRPILRFDDPERQSTRPEFATDGRRLFFTLTEREGDIWEMELNSLR